ncbi:CGNR zinc finger domain-containing protein [Nocardia brasiliensis]|uniref:CGNR zinc finger domain-containing protein n=1 Tax=Nocardia brasiliensis TaxID=37326 RepID=UPI001931C61B|nr:CGNR zinc finger domain-containing protein [Nocardia brasiliensis]
MCSADNCDRVYLDTSRNGTKRFCGTACQNRAKPPPSAPAAPRTDPVRSSAGAFGSTERRGQLESQFSVEVSERLKGNVAGRVPFTPK